MRIEHQDVNCKNCSFNTKSMHKLPTSPASNPLGGEGFISMAHMKTPLAGCSPLEVVLPLQSGIPLHLETSTLLLLSQLEDLVCAIHTHCDRQAIIHSTASLAATCLEGSSSAAEAQSSWYGILRPEPLKQNNVASKGTMWQQTSLPRGPHLSACLHM